MTKSFRNFTFAGLFLLSLVFWARPLFATLSLALGNDEYTHILLILPVSIALILFQKDSLFESTASNWPWGVALLLAALLTAGLGRWGFAGRYPDIALSLNMLALVGWWIGAVILCFGVRFFRAALFPLLFLLWLVPFPGFLLDRVVSFLQHGSASLTSLLFMAAGVPVSQHGVVLSIPELDIEVATECSSIRSSLMLEIASMVLAYLFLRSPWRRLAVVLAAVPLSVAKNALRIFTLTMLAVHVDPSFLTGRLHHQGGIVFFLVALAAICLMIWLLSRGEADSGSPKARLAMVENPAVNR